MISLLLESNTIPNPVRLPRLRKRNIEKTEESNEKRDYESFIDLFGEVQLDVVGVGYILQPYRCGAGG